MFDEIRTNVTYSKYSKTTMFDCEETRNKSSTLFSIVIIGIFRDDDIFFLVRENFERLCYTLRVHIFPTNMN